ncbi:MAG: FAD:protein FMN transferase [Planctomycetia bacterium]|nr:FAD:protein FMN transferase [Planctomycetia bacterium]
MGGPLTVFRHQAMACDFEISLNGEADREGVDAEQRWLDKSAAEAALDAFDQVDRVESILSMFRSNTELSRLNLLAAEMKVHCSDDFFRWLLQCRRLWEETGGAFDITSAPLWEVWGFARREGEIPSDEALSAALELTGMDKVLLEEGECRVAFAQSGIRLNFGGIGKGIAVDQASAVLRENRVDDFLLHGGRSSITASGGRAGEYTPESQAPCWTIGLSDPYVPERRIGEFYLSNRSLGTSGSQYQFFRYKGKRYPHIIDPRTGRCATGLVEVCVTAPDAALADALSTAFFVLGPEKAEHYCRLHPEIGAVFLQEAPVPRRYVVSVLGLNQNEFHLF